MKGYRGLLQCDLPIALAGQAQTVTENLIKRYAAEMATCVLGEESKEKLGTV
jgi:hypothetical protein